MGIVDIKVLRNNIKEKLRELLKDREFLVQPKNPEKPSSDYKKIQIFLGYLPITNNLHSVTPGIGIRSKSVKIYDKKQVSIIIEAILYNPNTEKRCDEMEELLETIADSFQANQIYGEDYFVVSDVAIDWEISDADLDPYITGVVQVVFDMPKSENDDYIGI